MPVGSSYGSLTYVRYKTDFFFEHLSSIVDSFMALILVRMGAGQQWPYATKQFSGQLPSDDNVQPFSFELVRSIPSPRIADDYLGTLLGVIKEQNAAHGLRQLLAKVEEYAPYSDGAFVQHYGPALLNRAQSNFKPVFVAVEDLIGQSIFLEVSQIGGNTYPDANKQHYIQFLERTLAHLKTLPPQVPFMGGTGEDTPDPQGKRVFYDLQRDQTETRASALFSYSLAVSVTEAFLSFAQSVSALSFLHFEVVAIVDGRTPAFIGYGTFAQEGTPVLGGLNGSSAAVDIA